METKRCFKCKNEKPTNAFYKNRSFKDGLSGMCKECSLQNERQNNQKCKEWLDDLKKSNPCSKCGDNRFYVIDIHHTDPTKKTMEVASYAISGTASFETKKRKILEELKSCIFLCSNCHREYHYLEKINKRAFSSAG